MFPGAHATIYRNEDGEPTGWDSMAREIWFCDACGIAHESPSGCYDED